MKVAIIHYWLVNMRGGEKVLEAICELFPEADIYTHVYDPKNISDTIKSHPIYTTFIQKLPNASKWYSRYLSLMPRALESLDLKAYDLIISSESGPAKGVITHSNTLHLCYCHTPMRYLWDYYHYYLTTSNWITRFFFRWFAYSLRVWDTLSANRVDRFIANSQNVSKRIMHIYRRTSDVIYPPVDIPDKEILQTPKKDFYLFLGQITSYKRVDLAINAFRDNGLPLIIAGQGDKLSNLPSNIKALGFVSSEQRKNLLAQAKALIFPGEEDFGIVMVEAMAHGTPVIAYAKGGALESVMHNVTGILFNDATVESLQKAIKVYEEENVSFRKEHLYEHAKQFSKQNFQEKIKDFINQALSERQ